MLSSIPHVVFVRRQLHNTCPLNLEKAWGPTLRMFCHAWVTRFSMMVALGSVLFAQSKGPQSKPILIQPEVQFQRFDGFGITLGNGAAKEIMRLPERERMRLMDLLFGSEGTHFNMIRNEITWAAKRLPMTHPLYLRGLRFYFADEENETDQFNLLREAQKRNEIIPYSCSWSPPPLWKTNLSENDGGELAANHYEDFAYYLGAYIDFYKKLRYLEIPFLSFQNNPKVSGPFQSCLWNPTQTAGFLKLVGKQFKGQGIHTQLILPESDWSSLAGYVDPIMTDPEARQWVSVIAAQSYTGDNKDRSKIKEISKRFNMKLWQTEYALPSAGNSAGMDDALRLAEQIFNDLLQAECQAWFYWVPLASPPWKGRTALLDGDTHSFKLTKRFWCLAQFSRFISNNSVRIMTSGGTSQVIAFRNPSYTTIALVLLNRSAEPVQETIQTREWNLERTVAYRTSQEEDCTVVPLPGESGSKLSLTLAPLSVTTFTAQIRRLTSRSY
jgi:O-glycosyl hydrolase